MLVLHKIHHLKSKLVFFSRHGAIIIFSSLIIFGISETRVVSFDAVLCMSSGSSTAAYSVSVSLLFSLTPFLSEVIFSVTFLFCPLVSTISENLNMSSLDRPFAIEISS